MTPIARLAAGLALALSLVAPADAAVWSVRETRLIHSEGESYDRMTATAADAGSMVVGADGAVWVHDLVQASFVERQRIPSPSGNTTFGRGVALDADTLAVGAPGENKAYVFARSGGVWTQQAALSIPDVAGGDQFGASVAVDGDTLVVGAPAHDHGSGATGAVYVYGRAGTAWTLILELRGSDAAAGDAFGTAVDFEAGTLLVGAPNEGPPSQAGAAYVFVGWGIVWEQQAKLVASDRTTLDGFGTSVALQGPTALVGAPGSFLEPNPGAAYAFTRSGIVWSEQTKLSASDATGGNFLGAAVALGDGYALIGAPLTFDASAYVYARAGATWTEQPKIYATTVASGSDRFGAGVAAMGKQAIVTASKFATFNPAGAVRVFQLMDETVIYGPVAPNRFGASIDADGDTLLVGAPNAAPWGANSGSAFALVRSGASWVIEGTLLAPNGASEDGLGAGVSIDGDLAVVGSPQRDDGALDAGAVYVFERSEGAWNAIQQLGASDPATSDELGNAVAISGDTVVAGARLDDDLGTSSGSAYVFVGSAGGFTQEAKLLAADGAAFDDFGAAVAIDGDTIVVGAPSHDDVAAPDGAAYVFARAAGAWTQVAELNAPDAIDGFGNSVAVDDDLIAIGAPGPDLAYVFERVAGVWIHLATLVGPSAFGHPNFGIAIDLEGDLVAVSDTESRRISVFERQGDDFAYLERLQRRFTDGSLSADVAISGATVFAGTPNTAQVSAFALARCGDGAVEIGESCDDGNHADGDGCSAACRWDCSDGLDGDGDGLTDFPSDPGCANAVATTESPQCDDELDNDGDAKIDWDGGAGSATPDPQCVEKPHKDREAKSGCGLGAELLVAFAAARLLGRRRR